LLSKRAEEANLQYLTDNKRKRKPVQKKGPLLLPPTPTTTTTSTSNDVITTSSTTTDSRQRKKKNRKTDRSSSEEESSSSSSSEEEEEEEEENCSSDNESVHDISDYTHLVDALHYDPDEKCVYKSTRVVEEGDYIVVYRKRQLKNGQWAKTESNHSIFAKDVVEMTKLYSMNNKK